MSLIPRSLFFSLKLASIAIKRVYKNLKKYDMSIQSAPENEKLTVSEVENLPSLLGGSSVDGDMPGIRP